MIRPKREKLIELLRSGQGLTDDTPISRWLWRVVVFLEQSEPKETLKEFESALKRSNHLGDQLAMATGFLEAQIAKLAGQVSGDSDNLETSPLQLNERRVPGSVFVVHGHDLERKEIVARFISKLGLEAVILHERPNKGNTIIEKFEAEADVDFAVILLTPDDLGGEKGAGVTSPRARQNVVLELGYFFGRLGRKKVCALYEPKVELPSDINGLLYIELDSQGAWKTRLAQELVEAGLAIDIKGLLSS